MSNLRVNLALNESHMAGLTFISCSFGDSTLSGRNEEKSERRIASVSQACLEIGITM